MVMLTVFEITCDIYMTWPVMSQMVIASSFQALQKGLTPRDSWCPGTLCKCNQSDLFIQYICIFQYILVYFRSCPVHSLQLMMSTNLVYFIILCFGVILVVKYLFAMSNVKG